MMNYVIVVVMLLNFVEIVLRVIKKIVWKLFNVIKGVSVKLVRIDKVFAFGGF